MKNRVSLQGYGEILAGRIARPYEKGTPRAKQGDEYWFFIKHFASISREKASKGEGEGWRRREREKERVKERKDSTKKERKGGPALLLSGLKEMKRDEFDTMGSMR